MTRQNGNSEWIASAEIQPADDEKWVLDYFLQSSDVENGEKIYGLRIDKSTPSGVLFEREETPALTDSRDIALRMAQAFAAGCVPPVTLLEMADEWCADAALV